MSCEVIDLEYELDDEDLIAICDAIDKHNTDGNTTKQITNKSKNSSGTNSITNYFDIYQKTGENSFKKAVPKPSSAPNDIIYLEDDDDDDLMQAVPFLFPTKSNSPWPKNDVKPATSSSQTKITSFYSTPYSKSTSGISKANTGPISDADAIAIANALDELDRLSRNNDSTSTSEIIDLATILDVIELESYNENAATIRSLRIIDPDLEHLDPNPDIHVLFKDFDRRFFDGYLSKQPLKLGWADNFFSVAGAFYPLKNGVPTILLSSKLLILRPRRDLVETLLHEMIHAFIGLQGLRDNNDHGKVFQFHMNRINRSSGTKITIYHSFHDEVSYWRKYIWRCDGKCRSLKPYSGFVSHTTQRKPNRWDAPFRLHQQVGCTGSFVEVSNNFAKNKKK